MNRVIVHELVKQFKIGSTKKASALGRLMKLFSGKEPQETICALHKVSFHAAAGEILGIIGKNGSGKSTLLRIIAGIYPADSGRIQTEGKSISLINLNLGMYPQLTMQDNICFLASVLGLAHREIREQLNPIVTFCGLEKFVHTQIYQLSEGMKQRLVFAIAVHCDPQILLLDEVFEVGDKEFKVKSTEKITALAKGGTTVLLVSHSLDLIEKYCDRVIWLEKGTLRDQGGAERIVKEYTTA